jgi:hypothetical protein
MTKSETTSDQDTMPKTARKLLAFYAEVDDGDRVGCWPIRQQDTPRARRLLIAGNFINPSPGYGQPTVTAEGRVYLGCGAAPKAT